jgi:hypothetical protein
MQPTYLADLTWPDVEALLERDDRLILVTGATEQHGRHLPKFERAIPPSSTPTPPAAYPESTPEPYPGP